MFGKLLVLDVERTSPEVLVLWERSRFLDRVAALDADWVLWDPHGTWPVAGERRVTDFAGLAARARREGRLVIAFVEGAQVFLDGRIVREGLEAFEPARTDYFTQWEHCRLPVGVGVRAVATQALERVACASPASCLDFIREHPAAFKFHYDMAHQTSFAHSLLDTRDSTALRALLGTLNGAADALQWDMFGFLALAKRADAAAPRYEPASVAPCVDERRMPAAYGFESPECAAFPTYIMFDIINVCNARCIHCPQSLVNLGGGKPDFLAERGHLRMDIFKRVVDELAAHDVQFVRITADGEPLVHKQLFDMIEYLVAKGVGPVGLTSNASLLTPEKSRRLLASGLAMVDFSLDALTPGTFEIVRAGLRFDKVMKNVRDFIALRDELGAPTKVMVSFVKQAGNVQELPAFIDYWTPRVDKVLVREMISNVGLVETSESAFPGWDQRWPCVHFFRRVVINHNGVLKACPIDWEQRTVYRSMLATTVYDAWHSHHYWLHRMQHLNDQIPDNDACGPCKDWAGTPWAMGYEKVVAAL